jgi:hypothetical protein
LQAGCQRWNDDEFNLETLNKPLKTKAKINPASVTSGAVNYTEGYVWVGTQRGSYVDVGLRKKASALPSPVSSCCFELLPHQCHRHCVSDALQKIFRPKLAAHHT